MAAVSSSNPLKARLGRFFGAHGQFCASHPWEVIVSVVTLTVCFLSIGVLRGGKVGTLCGINKPCEEKGETSDVVLLSMINSLAVIYVYNQFSSLRKAGSKYLLSIAGLFTIFASFVFGSGVVNLIDETASGLNEALPFFLLLIDLSKAQALANFAFRSKNKDEVLENIGRGMAVLGPNMTLDTLVEVLLIGIGTLSGARQLEVVCWFGAMSIIANYVVFMTFFPASLSLVMEVCPYDPSSTTWQFDELVRKMQLEEEQKKPNPVVQRVKIIMALGLTVVHLHSWFLSGMTGLSFGFAPQTEGGEPSEDAPAPRDEIEKVPLQEYLWWKAFNLSVDQIITLALAAVLFVKYIFFDKSTTFASTVPSPPAPITSTSSRHTITSPLPSSTSCPKMLNGIDHTSASGRHASDLSGKRVELSGVPLHNGCVPEQWAEPQVMSQHILAGVRVSGEAGVRRRRTLALTSLEHSAPDPPSRETPLEGGSDGVSVSVGTQTEDSAAPLFSVSGQLSSGDTSSSDEGEGSGGEKGQPQAEAAEPRPLEECLTIFKSDGGSSSLTDEEVLQLVRAKHIPAYKLESALGDPERGVSIRRKLVSRELDSELCLEDLPYANFNYSLVMGACCENVLGYMPVPVGVAGPLLLDGSCFQVPMATTEGTLVASTNRGCRALSAGGGVKSYLLGDGMTRGPVVRFPSAAEASRVKHWLDDPQNFTTVAEAFNTTSQFARLVSVHTTVAGRLVYIRFKATTGDAMGMNMLSKGVEKALQVIAGLFPSMEIISLSGNFCTDKKPAAINWIEGRGKSVVCEAIIPAQTVKQVLKTTVSALVDLNISKNLVGSAMAGSVGGFNAHAANIVTAIFIATGQDPAQCVASSNCITLMERGGASGEDLYMSCTMPSIEIGTIGGGTILPAQAACLKMLGVQGPCRNSPGENAAQLARVVCGTVLAGELSLMSALAAGHLVKSHLQHNRSQLNLSSIPEAAPSATPERTTGT